MNKIKSQSRKVLFCKEEIKYLVYYALAGLVLALLLLLFGISFTTTLSKFYGFIYMFLLPGLVIFRTVYKNKIFPSLWEEYGYPVLISWILHSLIIVFISGFFKTAINNLNLYGTSFVIAIGFAIFFYYKNSIKK